MKLESIDTVKQHYHAKIRGSAKIITFDYAWRKCYGAWLELKGHGWLADDYRAPERGRLGTIEGWTDYVNICEAIASYYESTGASLDCLLASEWKEYEDCKVRCRDAKGRRASFWVVRYGAACPYYARRATPTVGTGKRLENGAFYDVEVIGRAAKPIRKEAKHVLTESELQAVIIRAIEAASQ